MDNYFIYALIFGILGMMMQLSSFIHRKKERLLVFQIFSNMLYGFQYLFLNAISGFIISIICIIRNFLFFKNGATKKELLLTALSLVIVSIIFCKSFLDLLPMIAVLIYSYALYQNDMKKTRIIDIIACILCAIYDFIHMAYASGTSYIIEIFVVLFTIYQYHIKENNNVRKRHN